MQKLYEDCLREVERFTDLIGQSVDPKIQEVVASLVMNGYVTSSSCEGHPDQMNRCYPFVILNFPEPENEWEENARAQWLGENIRQQKVLAKDIEEFYRQHTALSFNSRLVINSFGAGVAELRSFGAEFIELEEDIHQIHALYLNEIQAFGKYLRNKK